MAKEEVGSHSFFCIFFYKETLLTSLFPLVFTAARYFPKLSAFFDSLQPLFLVLFIPREVWAGKGTIIITF